MSATGHIIQHPYYIRLRDEANLIVGGADTADHAMQLAAGLYARHGVPIDVELSSDGTILAELGRVTSGVGTGVAPSVFSLAPASAPVGSADLTLLVNGADFVDGAVIVFNGGDEPTTFVNATQVSTGVSPITASGPIVVPVQVRNPDGQLSGELVFEFTEATEPAPL